MAGAGPVQWTKVLANGGPNKLFQQTFGVFPGETVKAISTYFSFCRRGFSRSSI